MSLLRLVTWNVHGCVGADGLENPERIASVIRELDPDIIGLQEMREGALPRVAVLTGLQAIAGITRPEFQFGNALLTRHVVDSVSRHDVSFRVREPRGVLDVRLRRAEDGAQIRVLVTHFGLKAEERRRQAELLLALVQDAGAPLLAVMGDFNEWRPFVRTLHQLDAHLGRSAGVRSFPSYLPLFRLDRVWVSPQASLLEVRAWKGRGAWLASDHLPVTALVEFSRIPS